MCNRSSNSSESRPVWKLLLSKASPLLNEALDLMVNMVKKKKRVKATVLVEPIYTSNTNNFFSDSSHKSCFVIDSGHNTRTTIGHRQLHQTERPRLHPAVVQRTTPSVLARRVPGLPVLSHHQGPELQQLPAHVSNALTLTP